MLVRQREKLIHQDAAKGNGLFYFPVRAVQLFLSNLRPAGDMIVALRYPVGPMPTPDKAAVARGRGRVGLAGPVDRVGGWGW